MQEAAHEIISGRQRRRTKLTDVVVRRMRPPRTGRTETWDEVLPSFGLRCSSTGAKSFVLVTRIRGRPVRLTWKYPATSLAQARDHARDALQAIERGEDPRDLKRPAPTPPPDEVPATVEDIITRFVEDWCKPRNRRWAEQDRLLRACVVPVWKDRRLADIQRADVVALVDAIAKKTPTQANRVLATLKTLFRWALDRDLIPAHPAVGLRPPGKERARDRVLSDAEVKKLWAAWDAMGCPWGPVCKVLLLTATRRSEVQWMEWGEIDVDAALWTVPAARVKTDVPHLVPLADATMRLLADIPRFEGCPYVFTTRGKGPIQDFSGAVERATEKSGVSGWRPHDLRRTARTGLARLGVSADIGERVLGHVVGGVRGIYDRHQYVDDVRDALARWAAHVEQVVKADG